MGAYKQDFFYLSETKISFEAACKSFQFIGFSCFSGTDAINRRGGTFIAWKDYLDVEVVDISSFFCHCRISSDEKFLYITLPLFVVLPTLNINMSSGIGLD